MKKIWIYPWWAIVFTTGVIYVIITELYYLAFPPAWYKKQFGVSARLAIWRDIKLIFSLPWLAVLALIQYKPTYRWNQNHSE